MDATGTGTATERRADQPCTECYADTAGAAGNAKHRYGTTSTVVVLVIVLNTGLSCRKCSKGAGTDGCATDYS